VLCCILEQVEQLVAQVDVLEVRMEEVDVEFGYVGMWKTLQRHLQA